jgi:hypothetical protein
MDNEAFTLLAFREDAKVIGSEVAWCGKDILGVLGEIAASGVAVCGIESVEFPSDGGHPLVVAISDLHSDLKGWRRTTPWVMCVLSSVPRAQNDIERNVRDPYRDDVWYIVYGEDRNGKVLTAHP